MKAALVGRVIAEIEREALLVLGSLEFGVKAAVLQTHGALLEPEMLSKRLDEQDFRGSGRRVLYAQVVVDRAEFFF